MSERPCRVRLLAPRAQNSTVAIKRGPMLKFLAILPVVASVGGCASTTPATPSNRPTSAPAIQFEPGPGPYNLDWNIPGGKYWETDLRIPGQQIKISGTVQFVALSPNRTWSPMASV